MINDFCKKNNLNFDDLLKIVYLLDSNYKLGDKKAVEKAILKSYFEICEELDKEDLKIE